MTKASEVLNKNQSIELRSPIKWEVPPIGRVKVNLDVATKREERKIGIDVIIRAYIRAVTATLRFLKLHCIEPAMAKTSGRLTAETGVQRYDLRRGCKADKNAEFG